MSALNFRKCADHSIIRDSSQTGGLCPAKNRKPYPPFDLKPVNWNAAMKNQKLDEVRRTLQHLQHIASEPIDEDDSTEPDADAAKGLKSGWNRIISNFFTSGQHGAEKGTAAFTRLAGQRILIIGIGAFLVVGVAGLAAWAVIGTDEKPAPGMTTAATSIIELTEPHDTDVEPSVKMAIAEAQQLISAGKIDEARRRLLDLDDKSPEAALILARSYDPNYLRLIPDADAAADPKEAERWYRAWRDIAASKGLALDKDRLDRIINAMHY
jgi:hypothetical protein